MLNALRLRDGFTDAQFEARTGIELQTIGRTLEECERKGLLVRSDAAVRPTELGRRFLNDLQQLFLPEAIASAHPRRATSA
jgi:oxygen-independent coproporphyrinogen-3 oxidase